MKNKTTLPLSLVILLAACTILICSVQIEHTASQHQEHPGAQSIPTVATFSIVAFDPNTKELGIAVQSKVPGVGSIVPWAQANVGAVATQAYANTRYGPEGLHLLATGKSVDEVIAELTAADEKAAARQLGIVDRHGRTATYTGKECYEWAGGKTGKYYAVQGNILAGEDVVKAMAAAFEKSTGKELGARLLDALDAGQAAGGDTRGRQSAALLLVREDWGYGGYNDRYRDLRVEDHVFPIKELRRVYEIHKAFFPQPQAK